MQIAFDVRPRHTLEIVFATSNARIGKELSAGEVFWLRSGAVNGKIRFAHGKIIMASPRLLQIVYLSLLFVYSSELQ